MKVKLKTCKGTSPFPASCRICKKKLKYGDIYWGDKDKVWHKSCGEPALQGGEKEIIYVVK